MSQALIAPPEVAPMPVEAVEGEVCGRMSATLTDDGIEHPPCATARPHAFCTFMVVGVVTPDATP